MDCGSWLESVCDRRKESEGSIDESSLEVNEWLELSSWRDGIVVAVSGLKKEGEDNSMRECDEYSLGYSGG